MASVDPDRLAYHVRALYSLVLVLFLSMVANVIITLYIHQNIRFDCTRCVVKSAAQTTTSRPIVPGKSGILTGKHIDRAAVLLGNLSNTSAALADYEQHERRERSVDEYEHIEHRHRHHRDGRKRSISGKVRATRHGRGHLQDEANDPWLAVTSRISTQDMMKYCRDHCEKGDTGPVGPPGKPGFPGQKGDRGQKGDIGFTGAKGQQGIEGHRGLPGPKGEPGKPGEKGKDGHDGRKGLPGTPGLDGVVGRDGINGRPGIDGRPGTSGASGIPGVNGTNGRDGKDGAPGPRGPVGPPGNYGPRGKKGADGLPGTPAEPQVHVYKDTINDTYIYAPKFTDGTANWTYSVKEGDNIRITCIAIGNPPPTITWRLEDRTAIRTGQWLDNIFVGPQLKLTKANRIHSRKFECIADNGFPEKIRKFVTIEVHFSPYVIPPQRPLTPNGSWALLTCEVQLFPDSLRYWVHPSGRLVDNSTRFFMDDAIINEYTVTMKLNITRVNKDDYGAFKCKARNDLGSAEGVVKLLKETDPEYITTYEEEHGTIPTSHGIPPPFLEGYDDLCPAQACPICEDPDDVCIGGRRIIVRQVPVARKIKSQLGPRKHEPCVMMEIGKALYQRDIHDMPFGAWMKDSAPRDEKAAKRIWMIRRDRPQRLFEYEDRESYHEDKSNKEIRLIWPFSGNTHLVFNGSFYYTMFRDPTKVNEDQNTTVIRFDLNKHEGDLSAYNNVTLDYTHPSAGRYLYSSQHNYVDISADENGLWLIHGLNDSVNTFVRKVSPHSLDTLQAWNLTLNHSSIGETFIICGILYVVNNVTSHTSPIQVAYDLYTNRMVPLSKLEFTNPFRRTTMISYNADKKELLSWDNGNQLSYPVKLMVLETDAKDTKNKNGAKT